MPKGLQKTSWLLYGFAAFFISLFGYIYYTYETSRSEIMANIDSKLFNAAVSVRHILGDDYHNIVNAGLPISASMYKEKSRALSEYAKQMQLAYVYAMVLRDDKVYFSASSYTQKDQNNGRVTQFLDAYPEATELNKEAFFSTEPVFEISKDQWGYFKSIFVTFVDNNGHTYITGADITISDLNQQLQQSVSRAMITGCFFFFIAALIAGLYFLQLKRSLSTDARTGFANHVALEYYIKRTTKHRMELAVIVINELEDISSFYGSEVSDKVMANLLGYFQLRIPSEGVVYRLATNKIALLQTHNDERNIDDVINAFNYAIPALKEPYIYVSLYAGIATGNKSMLIENAHVALQQAKLNNQRIVRYENIFKQVEEQFRNNVTLAKEVKEAFDNNRIVPYFQAVYDSQRKHINHYQCLARMASATGRIHTPDYFMMVLKRSRMDGLLRRTMFTRCIEQFRKTNVCWSINITAQDILDPSLSEFLELQLRRYPQPHNIIFQFYERDAIAYFSEVKTFINILKNKGAQVIINEFGTGFSSLPHIRKLEIDGLKLDKGLVSQIHTNTDNYLFIENLVKYAQQLKLDVIAEQVDNEQIAQALARAGVTLMQGSHFAPPTPYIH
ncbi:MAG: GGDEF domain-containing protein [Pseudoalteromonas sp.]|mgnify:FL=1|uniref:bifunctional diguanylate cyclase/phosphodiesterase n=1 Tax=Pseudoalteromonas sp. TaxID=53249 RepID=UPI000C97D89A|nr:GGDEF domain-containing protein [Pseudoalteromonas sp.]MAD02756.1 GGDEF domain-containing protein [Pseudoalteromonas sp.]|tara:strand:- start:29698 stop:31548 length:1851 start_codon:yes stop_codon:yes gene_type:complete